MPRAPLSRTCIGNRERFLVNIGTRANPGLINTRFAYVSASRASQDAQIFTNDADTLGKSLSLDVSKTSAVDFRVEVRSTQKNHQQLASVDQLEL